MDRRTFTTHLATGLAGSAFGGALRRFTANTEPRINGARLNQQLADLRQFGGTPDGGTHRVGYSDADRDARAWIMQRMREAGLEPSIDFAGNLIGRRAGTDPSRPPLTCGSHIDTVPYGGSYDGHLGVLAAIEAARVLHDAGTPLRHALEVIVFQNEEGGVVGSRALVGELLPSDLDATSQSGKTFGEGMAFIGGDPTRYTEVVRKPGSIAAYVELHIEQGGTLEANDINIGVVEGIVGLRWWDVTITGTTNHAGTTPMDQRRDAMRGAAQFIEMVNRVVRAEPGQQVGTVGRLRALPGAPNVIPGRVECSLELRDLNAPTIDRLYNTIEREARKIDEALGTSTSMVLTQNSSPALMHQSVMRTIDQSARTLGATTRLLPSGAGHDAQHMAALGPSGMIFVPSKDGISHSPAEYTSPADCTRGADVLLSTLIALDASPPT